MVAKRLDTTRRTLLTTAAQGALVLAAPTLPLSLARAQSDYPNRSIRVIVPFAPGSATDILTRHLEQSMSASLGQKLVIENRPGANGVLGAQVVKSATPDGYTICMGSTSSHSIVAAIRPNTMPYDIEKDFSPIGLAAMSANIIATHPSVPVKNLQELIAYSNTLPSGLSYASSPAGSSNSLAGDMLRTKGAKLVNIPYNNISQGLTDVLAGHVPVLIYTVALLPYIRDGRLRGIATLSEKRLSQAPDLPTAIEQGVPGMLASAWFGMFGPARLPAAVTQKISTALGQAIADKTINNKLIEAGIEPQYLAPQNMSVFVAQDMARWKEVVAKAGVKTE